MKHILTLFILVFSFQTYAQKITIPADTLVVTTDHVVINGQDVPYKANTGTQPVWDDKGQPIATLFYTYYQRSDIKNTANRPLVFSFNGGPGSASVWMHIAYTGPKILKIDAEGYPVQPYGIKDNPNSILDVADIVFVNPVNTGYSRMIPDKEGKMPDKATYLFWNQCRHCVFSEMDEHLCY